MTLATSGNYAPQLTSRIPSLPQLYSFDFSFLEMTFSILLTLVIYLGSYQQVQSQSIAPKDSLQRVLLTSKDSMQVDVLNQLADEYLFSNNDSAFDFGQRALGLSTTIQYKKGVLKATNTLGIIYALRGDYARSLEAFTQLLRLQEEQHDIKGQAGTLSNIAKLYKEQLDYNAALNYLSRAKEIDESLGNQRSLADDYGNMGIIKKALDDFTGAFQSHQKALHINYALRDSFSVATELVNLSEISSLQGKYIAARDSAQKALIWFSQLANPYGNMHALHALAAAFEGLKLYDKANDYCLQALAIARKQNWQEKEAKIYSTLISISAHVGDFKNAYEYNRQYQAIKDTLFNKEKTKIINEIKEKYETEQRDQRILFLEDEAAYQARLRTFYVIASFLGLCVSVLVVTHIRRRNKALKREKHIAEQNLLLEQEKAHLTHLRLEQEQLREHLDKERMRQEQERIVLENERIALELDENQRQLLTSTIQIQQHRETLKELEKTFSALKKSKEPEELKKGIDQLIKGLRQQIDLSDDWQHMKLQFEKVHPSFFNSLQERFPSLTLTELKLCAYTKMNFNGKEMSRLLNINPSSIQVARYRLKKKMNLPEEVNFFQFITENF